MSKIDNYFVVGKKINYSLSPIIHNFLFDKLKINAKYSILNLNSISEIEKYNYVGLNITIPFKTDILNENFEKDALVNESLHANTVYKDKLFSTDQYGFLKAIEMLNFNGIENVIILGSGSMSKMVYSILKKKSKNIITFGRKSKIGIKEYKELNKMEFKNYMIVNCSPMGVDNNEILINDNIIEKCDLFFNMNYSPMYDEFRKKCIKYNVEYHLGIDMLLYQAYQSFEIWTKKVDKKLQFECKMNLINSKKKLIITGMPFSGKTYVFENLKKSIQKNAIDLDAYIESKCEMPVSNIINNLGIDFFRKLESKLFKKLLFDSEVKIIITGGGTLIQNNNINMLNDEIVINITPSLEVLISRFTKSRANIKNIDELQELYKSRKFKYNNISFMNVLCEDILRFLNENYNN